MASACAVHVAVVQKRSRTPGLKHQNQKEMSAKTGQLPTLFSLMPTFQTVHKKSLPMLFFALAKLCCYVNVI